jgi:CRISPR-associated protein Csd2
MSNTIQHRYDFVYLFDVINGNPNGDPDAGNAPRLDPETGRGLVSDVCLKRKIRNFIMLAKGAAEGAPAHGYDIYVKEKAVLNEQHARAYKESIDLKDFYDEKAGKSKPGKEAEARRWMCANFFDVRMFGAVMSTSVNCGQVRGPVQFAFATSVDPIVPLEQSVTRMAVTTEKEAQSQGGDNRTMGRKTIIPYALYRGHGFISPQLAAQTGFSEEDLDLLKQSLGMMFDHDRSAARGMMAPRACIAFRHDSPLGNAPAHRLFERITIKRTDESQPAREFGHYSVRVDESNLPAGITVERWV